MSTLGKNIKALRKQQKYNQKELALILGVSQTSIAHYEAGTRQPTIETLMQLSQIFEKSIDQLVGHSVITVRNNLGEDISQSQLVDLFVDFLVNKKEESFIELFEDNVYKKYEIDQIMDSILKKVMYRIGDMWEKGKISEADEHYATSIVRKVINYLSVDGTKTIKNKKALSFIIGSEKHTLGLEMVNTFLESKGVEALYLGNNLPLKSIDNAIKENVPNYIFISITMEDNLNSLIQLVDYINEKADSNLSICIGGQGLESHKQIQKLENIHILKDLDDVTDFLLNN